MCIYIYIIYILTFNDRPAWIWYLQSREGHQSSRHLDTLSLDELQRLSGESPRPGAGAPRGKHLWLVVFSHPIARGRETGFVKMTLGEIRIRMSLIRTTITWLVVFSHASEKWWSSSNKGWWDKPNINGKMPNWWQPNHQPVMIFVIWLIYIDMDLILCEPEFLVWSFSLKGIGTITWRSLLLLMLDKHWINMQFTTLRIKPLPFQVQVPPMQDPGVSKLQHF